jgi:hypothetical protein
VQVPVLSDLFTSDDQHKHSRRRTLIALITVTAGAPTSKFMESIFGLVLQFVESLPRVVRWRAVS